MTAIHRLMVAALGLCLFASLARAQEPGIAAAANADVIARYSPFVEKRLLRVHFDRGTSTLSLAPFGPPGPEKFAVAPNAAFVVASVPLADGMSAPSLSLIDEAGHALGGPLRSPVGAVAALAISPWGDRVAVGSDRGWLVLLAVEGTGTARRLTVRREIGVTPDWQFTFAFRPDGSLVTIVDDWRATFFSGDGVVQHRLDLKALNRDLEPAPQDMGSLFQLAWSPQGDRFAVSWGAGPMFTTLFNADGRRVKPAGADSDFNFGASKTAFVDGGDALIVSGMQAPALVRLKTLAAAEFGDPDVPASSFTPLAGGRDVAVVIDDRIAVWSLDGKPLVAPTGLENYSLGVAAAGAKDDVIVAAERAGWIDFYGKTGTFIRRVQSRVRDTRGQVALSADGATLAALGSEELGVIANQRRRAWETALSPDNGALVAVAGNGSRLVIEGPNRTLRSWSRDGTETGSLSLRDGDKGPSNRLCRLAVSPTGDLIAVAEEGAAVWLVSPVDKGVRRVPLAATTVTPLPDGAGFAVGLADGTVVRLSRDGTVQGPPVRVFDRTGVAAIVVAPEGRSFIAVDTDQQRALHLGWEGTVLAGPYREDQYWQIAGAFFQDGSPKLITRFTQATTDEGYGVVDLVPPGTRSVKLLESPR